MTPLHIAFSTADFPFQILLLISAVIACVNAGGPAAYSISVPAIDHASAGQTQEHTVKVCNKSLCQGYGKLSLLKCFIAFNRAIMDRARNLIIPAK